MDLDEIGALVFLFAIIAALLISLQFIVLDYRLFSKIHEQCSERGYIQSKEERIICSIEEKK